MKILVITLVLLIVLSGNFGIVYKDFEEYPQKVNLNQYELKERLTEDQWFTMYESMEEKARTGKFYKHFEDGLYHCGMCNLTLFDSEHKFDNVNGYAGFHTAVGEISLIEDERVKGDEAVCDNCGCHLGHKFDDPAERTPTGVRYFVNSNSLWFEPREKVEGIDVIA